MHEASKFTLYVAEKQGIAFRVLTQKHANGLLFQAISLSGSRMTRMCKSHCNLSTHCKGGCKIKPETATRNPILTPGLEGLRNQGSPMLNGGKGYVTRYQALILDSPLVILKVCQTLNPATLFPT